MRIRRAEKGERWMKRSSGGKACRSKRNLSTANKGKMTDRRAEGAASSVKGFKAGLQVRVKGFKQALWFQFKVSNLGLVFK